MKLRKMTGELITGGEDENVKPGVKWALGPQTMYISPPYLIWHVTRFSLGNLWDLEKSRKSPVKKSRNIRRPNERTGFFYMVHPDCETVEILGLNKTLHASSQVHCVVASREWCEISFFSIENVHKYSRFCNDSKHASVMLVHFLLKK